MKVNESMFDRSVRVLIGLGLVALWVFGVVTITAWAIVAVAVGAILVLTGLVGFCPLYAVLGGSTARKVPVRKA